MAKMGYYPGCSLRGSSANYDRSLKLFAKAAGIELLELDDWNCCGASTVEKMDRVLSVVVPGRNLLIAQDMGLDKVLAPCPTCYLRLEGARRKLHESEELASTLEKFTGKRLERGLSVLHTIHILSDPSLMERVKGSLKSSLSGLKVACYYGCYAVRPSNILSPEDPENPQVMERWVSLLGGEPVDWSWKVDCCGASHVVSNPGKFSKMVRRLAELAKSSGAEAMATLCPLCYSNLEMYGEEIKVFFLTELVAMCMEKR